MSGNQTTKPFTDAYVEEGTTDSGFLSGGDLMSSGEIREEQPPSPAPQQPKTTSTKQQQQPPEDEYMRLDSGVDLCLSESFSSLSLKNPLLNDFSRTQGRAPKVQTTPTPAHHQQQQQQPPPVDSAYKTSEDILWKVYFEQDEDGDTPLHAAIAQGICDVVLALIRRAPHPLLLDTPNDDAQTPIHLAVSTGHYQIVRWLIVAGAKPLPRNKHGDSPLHIAARNGDLKCCKAITDPVQQQERQNLGLTYTHPHYHQLNLDQWNYEGQTCVHVAAICGHVDVLRHFILFGADINAREGLSGYTALHYSIQKGDERLQRFLLSECKNLDVNTVTYGGKTCLELSSTVQSSVYEDLKRRGVPSPYSSDDDSEFDSSSESDQEMTYESTKLETAQLYALNLVKTSA